MTDCLRGVIPVLPTPFRADETVDLEAVGKLVRFALACGASAACLPAYGSEFYKLTDAERLDLVRVAVEAADGRLPIIAQANHMSALYASGLAQRMEDLGAAAIGLALPRMFAVAEQDLFRFAERICQSTELPVMIQDFNPGGGSVGVDFCRRLHKSCPNFQAIKLEEAGLGPKAQAIVEGTGGGVGVLEGWGGLYMLELDPRYVVGCVPGLSVADALVRVAELLDAGDAQAAFELHVELVPYLTFILRNMEAYHLPEKLALVSRGALDRPSVRDLTVSFDGHGLTYLKRLLDRLWRTLDAAGLPRRPLG